MQMMKVVFRVLLHALVRDGEERVPATYIHPHWGSMWVQSNSEADFMQSAHGEVQMVNGGGKNSGL